MNSARTRQLLAALVLAVAAAGIGHAQVTTILSDDFETGVDGANVNGFAAGGIWGRTGFASATPKYASVTNPFASGALYADMNNPTLAADDTLLLTSEAAADSHMIGPNITNKVTTFSFDFWEPTTPTAVGIGTAVGYTINNDLNAAGRAWRAALRGGTLHAPEGYAEGAAVTYPLEKVNTVWLVANDTASDVVNYAGGRTLVSKRADIWISRDGAAPEFAFAVNRQNAATVNIVGIGFRAFSTDAGRLLLDNVLLASGASLDRSAISLKAGDVDADGDVDINDFNAIRDHFQRATTLRSEGDLNKDGRVDFSDFRQWKSHASAKAVVAANMGAVPEPPGAALALIGVAVGQSMRRHVRTATR